MEAAIRFIPELKLDFAFVYIGCTDTAGHYYGWMTDGYIKQIELTDGLVGQVLDTVLPLGATVIIHADHGGHDRDHGTDMTRRHDHPLDDWRRGCQEGAYDLAPRQPA